MAYHPLDETLARLKDRRLVWRAMIKAVEETAPSDTHPEGPGPRFQELARRALDLAAEYLHKYHDEEAYSELAEGENILASGEAGRDQPLLFLSTGTRT